MKYTGISEIGLYRDENQDSISVVETETALLAILCDGIGGGNAGSIASKMVVTLLKESFIQVSSISDKESAVAWFSGTIAEINRTLYHESLVVPEYRGMGTTLVACVILADDAIAFNIGDSRLYTYTDSKLNLLTEDQTYAYEMYLRNEIELEEIQTHPKRHVLMNAVGIDEHISYDTIHIPEKWDYILMSSDGLHGYVSDELILKALEIEDILNKRKALISLAYKAGGYDNVSVILIEGDDYDKNN